WLFARIQPTRNIKLSGSLRTQLGLGKEKAYIAQTTNPFDLFSLLNTPDADVARKFVMDLKGPREVTTDEIKDLLLQHKQAALKKGLEQGKTLEEMNVRLNADTEKL